MSWWANLIVFLLALPISVWIWACFMAIFDNVDKLTPLLRFSASIVSILALVLLIDRAALWPLVAALAIVVSMHIGGFWIARKLIFGIEKEPR